ncbi:unnamed protein product [Heterosigma akashiwo]|mmetsp:Transcript_22201/g.34355  ORF Transcript_22201/g.34355 Transcript_22201/m.34355 type:complete len:199 (-) Transcript_22201:55-651(-)
MDVPLMLPEDETNIHKEPVQTVLEKLNTSLDKGLTNQDANSLRDRYGENLLKKPVDCPSWLCCLLPCLGNVASNQLFGEVVPDDALVLRNGRWITLDASSLVRGDIVKVQNGESVAADMRVLECSPGTQVSQLYLTGKDAPKDVAVEATAEDFLESGNMLFLSSHVVQGECTSVVVAVGDQTALHQLIRAGKWPPANL